MVSGRLYDTGAKSTDKLNTLKIFALSQHHHVCFSDMNEAIVYWDSKHQLENKQKQ